MPKRTLPSLKHAETLSLNGLRSLVMGPVEKSDRAEAGLEKLEAENTALRKENAELLLENLPPRPPFRPSGMDEATDAKAQDRQARRRRVDQTVC
ncbi:hypothetical protein M8994_19435 [Brucella sp. 21LCYQ03]|nr:hypothetical protein [Brucella sp. 21LCYQ03]